MSLRKSSAVESTMFVRGRLRRFSTFSTSAASRGAGGGVFLGRLLRSEPSSWRIQTAVPPFMAAVTRRRRCLEGLGGCDAQAVSMQHGLPRVALGCYAIEKQGVKA